MADQTGMGIPARVRFNGEKPEKYARSPVMNCVPVKQPVLMTSGASGAKGSLTS